VSGPDGDGPTRSSSGPAERPGRGDHPCRAGRSVRDRNLARATHSAAAMEAYDANYVGGDINGGVQDIHQLLFRPWPTLDPYRVGDGLIVHAARRWVHGMSGYWAARSALRHELR